MTSHEPTIGELIAGGNGTDTEIDSLALEDLKKKFEAELEAVDTTVIREALLKKLVEALDDPLTRVLARAWSKYSEIRKYADRTKYPAASTYLVALREHTVKSEHQPSVEVRLNGTSIGKLQFGVTLAINLESFELEIQDGHIRRIHAGHWQGSGEISLEHQVFYRKAFEAMKLPGVLELGDSVPIT